MDINEYLPYIVAGGMTISIMALISFFTGRTSKADERLERMRDPRGGRTPGLDGAPSGNAVTGALEKAAPTLSSAMKPQNELEQNQLKIRLANAGFSSPNAYTFYLAMKTASFVLGAFIGFGYGVGSYSFTVDALMPIVVGAAGGMFAPEVVLSMLRSSRQQKIFLQLPDALDLLVVCVEAGLGLDAAMRKVSEELCDSAPEVCQELDIANNQMNIGRPRREVLHDLGVRTGVDDMRSLAAILIQADRFGSSIAQALRVQSDSMRIKRKHMAEEKAQKVAVKMMVPLILFIFPGIFVVLVGPAAIMLMNGLLDK